MPRRIIDRLEELQLDLRHGATQERVPWMHRHMQALHLSKPGTQLDARGVWVRPPGARSQGAVVKLWATQSSSTGGHLSYLQRGKGKDGKDAELFDAYGRLDRQAFMQLCRGDGSQLRGMLSPDAGDRADLSVLMRRLMRQMARDCETPLQWAAAIHHDTGHPHVHFVLRGVLDTGAPLVLTRHYWSYGFRFRAQGILTDLLGPTPGYTAQAVAAVKGWLASRSPDRTQEVSRG